MIMSRSGGTPLPQLGWRNSKQNVQKSKGFCKQLVPMSMCTSSSSNESSNNTPSFFISIYNAHSPYRYFGGWYLISIQDRLYTAN